MKICIPVLENKGIDSIVSEHFGSAPFFLIIDTETLKFEEVNNFDQHHAHGMCQPLSVISAYEFDGIVVGGIGTGALNKLRSAGKKVYKTTNTTVKETVSSYKNGSLKEVNAQDACAHHHGHNDDCGR